jgi:peptidoglycan/xylan/chitin deacetylase (PgdA/CDA1 family)
MFYIAKTPGWVRKFFSGSIWDVNEPEKSIYLSFDDGPHPVITPFVLDELKKYNALATFFCIGKNVVENPLIFSRIQDEGHAVGNHTYDHLNGWKTSETEYLQNIAKAAKYIDSHLFRPPYGRIKATQHKALGKLDKPLKVVMWSVLSGDFDVNITPEKCCENVLKNAESGSVIVFHDSEKAYERLRYALPLVLEYFSGKGYQFEKIV